MLNRQTKLFLKDLATPQSFRVWVKENLRSLYLRKEVPEEHLLIFLEYLRTVIREDPSANQSSWMELIRNLETKIKSIIKSKE